MKKIKNKFETGAKFGNLTIICVAVGHRENLLICSCDCFQIVKLSESELVTRTACLKCEAKKDLKRFKLNDVAVCQNSIGELPFNSHVIVCGFTEDLVEIEYRGRIYKCRPSELENLGINFF